MGVMRHGIYYRLRNSDGRSPERVYEPITRDCFNVQAAPVSTTPDFVAINRWCFDEIGETGWAYQGWDFWFDDARHALAFKLRWG